MLLHIFTKRTKGGDLLKTGYQWHEAKIEASRFLTERTPDGFLFGYHDRYTGEWKEEDVREDIQGYELFNDQGVSIAKFVTPVTDDVLSMLANKEEVKESAYSGIKYQKLNKALSDTDHSVYFVRNDDPDNAVLAGYGGTYGEALLDFAKRLDKSKYRLNDNLEFEHILDDVKC